jgi:hypothetical protein
VSHSSWEDLHELMTPDSMAFFQMVGLVKSTMTCVLIFSPGPPCRQKDIDCQLYSQHASDMHDSMATPLSVHDGGSMQSAWACCISMLDSDAGVRCTCDKCSGTLRRLTTTAGFLRYSAGKLQDDHLRDVPSRLHCEAVTVRDVWHHL